jgi:hypothetical protein
MSPTQPADLLRKHRQKSHESDAVTPERSEVQEPRPRNPEVDKAWRKYAAAFEERNRLLAMTSPTLAQNYAAAELARIRTLEDKNNECGDLLMDYFRVYDADQLAAFGTRE